MNGAPATRPPMTVAALRTWLGDWVAAATGLSRSEVHDDRPLEEFGLASRDTVALSGELEEMLGESLSATLVWEFPTIAALATRLIEGETTAPEPDSTFYEGAHGTSETTAYDGDVAVVGLAARLPGGVRSPERLWEVLSGGVDTISDVEPGRWAAFAADPAQAAVLDRTNVHGGFLDDVQGFDAEFFGIAPREAASMDPQQRLVLEVAWEALEHAAINPDELKGSATGVYVGVSTHDYGLITTSDLGEMDVWTATGAAGSIIANRLSYLLDLRGPSMTLDSACSSSLLAVHQAVRSLRSGEIDAALVGGVNMVLAPTTTVVFDQGGALAPDGRCKAFDASADGIARGEGAGMVVLKRLSDAERDGDEVLAVIAGSAVNSDGRSNGLMAPNPAAQADLLRLAYRDAGVHPNQVDYVEAHGTGTLLGDPIEARALGAVLGAGRELEKPLLLGSAKTNFGHLEAAAGITGLIKVVLALQNNALPPSLHFETPNPHIPFEAARLEVVTGLREWPRHSGQAVAGVSGFGFGGTNAHLVVREAPAREHTSHDWPQGASTGVLALSAPTRERLQAAAGELADWLMDPTGREESLAAVGRALARRAQGRHRAALVVQKHDEAVQAARAVAEGSPGPGVHTGVATDVSGAVWVFSGFGSQWHGMARDLLVGEPAFAEAWDALEPLIEHEAGFSLRASVLADEPVTGLDKVQIVLFAVQVGLAAVLRAHGARPAAVLGHSMGEVAAAVVAGGLDLETAVRVIVSRSRLLFEMEQLGGGAMGLVGLSAAELAELATKWPSVTAAVHAAPAQTTVAGDREEVGELVAHAESLGRLARLLDVRGAGHTAAVDPVLGELTAELAGMDAAPCNVPLFSSVSGEQAAGPGMEPVHTADYWTTGVRQPVLFTEAVAAAVRAGFTTFVELSPHPVTLASVGATLEAEGVTDPLLIPTQRRKTDGVVTLRGALAELHVHGHDVDLRTLNGDGTLADVPRTAWQHTRHWTRSRPSAAIGSAGAQEIAAPGVYVAMPDGRHAWQSTAGTDTEELVAAAAVQVLGASATVSTLVIHQLAPGAGTPVTTIVVPHPGGGSVQVHAQLHSGVETAEGLPLPAFWVLLAEAVVLASPSGETGGHAPERAQIAAGTGAVDVASLPQEEPPPAVETLRRIIAEVLGYASNKLPSDVPLTELGLDSLMAVRIKNRVEYELGTPPVALEALRGVSLGDLQEQLDDLISGGSPASFVGLMEVAPRVQAVAPRDAAERWAVAQWDAVIGVPLAGVTTQLPPLSPGQSLDLATALGGRWDAGVDQGAVATADTLAELADEVRPLMDASGHGVVHVLKSPVVAPGATEAAPLFLFHPAGGSCSVYEPLIRLLPADQPVYGVERVEAPMAERIATYLPLIREHGGKGPYRLAGWSFGGALAFEVGRQLSEEGNDVELIAMLDTVQPSERVPAGAEESLARWQRFAAYVERTYGQPVPLPERELLGANDDEQMDIVLDLLKTAAANAGAGGISAGVLEHQRTSWVDSRAVEQLEPQPYGGRVVLYRADRMHEGAIEIEPRYTHVEPDGGWAEVCPQLELVSVGGDHLAIIDEPIVSKVAEHLSAVLTAGVNR